jgi:N-acetylglucosamine-6-phosphate deacetylase
MIPTFLSVHYLGITPFRATKNHRMATLFARKLFTDSTVQQNQLVIADNGTIIDVRPARPDDKEESLSIVDNLSAAFVDLQVNGGSDLNFTETGNLATVRDIDQSCADLGTGFTLPTIISSPLENILKGIEAVREYQLLYPASGILGMHLEGPFINPLMCGAHPHSYIRPPSNGELTTIIQYGKGVIKLMTIAPELFTDDQIAMLLGAGIILSAGHSNAKYNQARESFGRGIHLVTHLYNAMSPFLARFPGLVGAAFDTEDVATPMILDGFHSDYCAARMAYKIKREKLFFVSDALFVGRVKQHYEWGEFNAHLHDKQYTNSEGHFAGSSISLGEAVYNAVFNVGVPLPEAIHMVTQRPARAIGMEDTVGRIQRGYPAAFTIFDDTLQSFKTIRI